MKKLIVFLTLSASVAFANNSTTKNFDSTEATSSYDYAQNGVSTSHILFYDFLKPNGTALYTGTEVYVGENNDSSKSNNSKALNRNFCDILYPGEIDNSQRHCVNRNYYSVIYDGKILDNICFSNINQAYNKMDRSEICNYRPPARVDYCEISGPGEHDLGDRRCNNRNYYSVVFDGYIVDGTCYEDSTQALRKAYQTRACSRRSPLRMGRCELLNPGQKDIRGVSCVNKSFYAYTFRDQIVGDRCYSTIDQALNEMQNSPACMRRDRR